MNITVTSSNGHLIAAPNGIVIEQHTSADCDRVIFVDFDEYRRVWDVAPPESIDIMDVRCILQSGKELVWSHYRARRQEIGAALAV